MDETLHAKLVDFVSRGGTLLLSASHLNVADAPGEPFRPFRWSTYADGTVYLLNTEESLAAEVAVRRSPTAPAERHRLAAGELKELLSAR